MSKLATTQVPLNDLTGNIKGRAQLLWTPATEAAFHTCKQSMDEAIVTSTFRHIYPLLVIHLTSW